MNLLRFLMAIYHVFSSRLNEERSYLLVYKKLRRAKVQEHGSFVCGVEHSQAHDHRQALRRISAGTIVQFIAESFPVA